MPQAIVKYDLNDHDDNMSFRRAAASLDMAAFIFEVLNNGKKRCIALYGENPDLHLIWQYLYDEAANHNINIDNLIE